MNETTAQPSTFETDVRAALAAGRAQPPDPDPLAATISLAGAVAPASREWLEDWLREGDELHEELKAAEDAIKSYLPRDGWELLMPLDSVYGALATHEQEMLLETIATHMPGLAPALRAIYQHVTHGGAYERVLGCCKTIPTD